MTTGRYGHACRTEIMHETIGWNTVAKNILDQVDEGDIDAK